MSFSNLGLTPSLCHPLARLGYDQPTPIQTQAIPVVLTGADLLARAQTGTGKTAAFGLPMIERLIARHDHSGSRRQPNRVCGRAFATSSSIGKTAEQRAVALQYEQAVLEMPRA